MNKMNNRRDEKMPSWVGWIGNMATPGDFIISKPWMSLWCPMKIANSFFRSLGVVAFACSPLTGILIFSGMILGNIQVAIGGTFGGLISILASKILNVSEKDLGNGVSIFNSILLGSVMTAVLPSTLGVPVDVKFVCLLAVCAFITTFVDQGLNALMGPIKFPGQSAPFNLISTLLFLSLTGINNNSMQLESGFEPVNASVIEASNMTAYSIEWPKVWQGVLLSTGQIYGVGTAQSSICIWLGFLLYSPLLSFMFFIGATTGSFLGIIFSHPPFTDVYQGLWGYNALLACGGMAFFVVPTPIAILSSVVNAVIASGLQAALIPVFSETGLPVLSYPFNISIAIVLAIALGKNPPLIYVTDRTFPELHAIQYRKQMLHPGPDDESAESALRANDKL